MKRRMIAPAGIFLGGFAVLTVFGYNLWSYCCGRCSVATFLTLGPFGQTLLALNVLAGSLLLILKLRRRARHREHHCSCGTVVARDWAFCPSCGDDGPPRFS